MHKVTVKIDRLIPGRIPVRGPSTEDKLTPELMVVSVADSPLAALDKAIRILTGERTALASTLTTNTVAKRTVDMEEEEDEEDEV